MTAMMLAATAIALRERWRSCACAVPPTAIAPSRDAAPTIEIRPTTRNPDSASSTPPSHVGTVLAVVAALDTGTTSDPLPAGPLTCTWKAYEPDSMIHTFVANVPASPGTGVAGSAGGAPLSP